MRKENMKGYLAIFILMFFLAIAGALEAPPTDVVSISHVIITDAQGEPQLVAVRE